VEKSAVTEPILNIEDDGTLLMKGINLKPPQHWKPSGVDGIYDCQLPRCRYRRFSCRASQGALTVRLHCFLDRQNCLADRCLVCTRANADFGEHQHIKVETAPGVESVGKESVRVIEENDLDLLTIQPWVVQDTSSDAAPSPPQKQNPQPKTTHGRPRLLADGVIAYPKRGWEPPPVPDGYKRKGTNLRAADAWIFIPVMEPCIYRKQEITYTACGAAKTTYHCRAHDRTVTQANCQTCCGEG
jgi:hypothetical protein